MWLKTQESTFFNLNYFEQIYVVRNNQDGTSVIYAARRPTGESPKPGELDIDRVKIAECADREQLNACLNYISQALAAIGLLDVNRTPESYHLGAQGRRR